MSRPYSTGDLIRVNHVTKTYAVGGQLRTVIDDAHFTLGRGERIGILGRNGSGKSTLIRMIGGASRPSSGTVERYGSVSWPLAFGGAFQGSLTGLDNLRFVCRIYGVDIEAVRPGVEEFAELGIYFKRPVKEYSSGMRSRLAFAISMAVDFDCLLIDEIISVGDDRFRERCKAAIFDAKPNRTLVLVSHEEHVVRAHCTRAAVLVDGRFFEFDDIDYAFEFYRKNA